MNQIPINKNFETSPNVYARIGGLAYLIIIVAGAMGEIFIRGKIIVPGDDLATTRNIAASSLLWRVGIVGDLVMHVFDLVLGVVYYMLLKRVNKTLALLSLDIEVPKERLKFIFHNGHEQFEYIINPRAEDLDKA